MASFETYGAYPALRVIPKIVVLDCAEYRLQLNLHHYVNILGTYTAC